MAAADNQTRLINSVSKVGIIGAGISGIAAAKQLSGHSPVVFEATDSIGGVWKHCSYNCTKLQTPRCDFQFSDYPWAERDNSSFPSHVEVLDYLAVWEPLTGHPVWEVAVQTSGDPNTIQWYAFEFIVICIGKYGDIPRMPSFLSNKGQEVFQGKVLHSMDYSKLDNEAARELLKARRLQLLSFKKSGMIWLWRPDGQACTMVIRNLHWTVPSYWIWGLPFFLFYSTRSSQFLHERPNQSLFRALLCLLASPMRMAISKFIESYLVWKLPLVKYGLKPDHPFVETMLLARWLFCLRVFLLRQTRKQKAYSTYKN
ncbi:hypothetical protein GBA52_028311 [Prunus armeniaca]|nr:hypothetical protein GBA52_028311 [Prunus armeniaca]